MVSGPLDLARVALLTTEQHDLVSVSGYQVTGRLVLTASHGVKDAKEIRVLTATSGDWVLAELAWIDEKADAALLSLSPNLAGDIGIAPVEFNGDPPSSREVAEGAVVLGFVSPVMDLLKGVNVDIDVAQIRGNVVGASSGAGETLEFVATSRMSELAKSDTWPAGLTGASLWIDGGLAGVITRGIADGRRLYATSAKSLLDNPEFRQLISDRRSRTSVEPPNVVAAGRSDTVPAPDPALELFSEEQDSSAIESMAPEPDDLAVAVDEPQEFLEPEATHQLLERLSPAAARALTYADAARKELGGHSKVHMEHLILGLNDEREGPTRRLVDHVGIGQPGLRAALVNWVSPPQRLTVASEALSSLPPFSSHAFQAVDAALKFADATGSPVVDTEHLLRGALSIDCEVVESLSEAGIDLSALDAMAAIADADATTQPNATSPARARQLAGAAADTVPEPGDGRVRAADRLDTAAEVEMLVSVLLARDTPLPLAVGLFGDWGSGKSFFMAHMQERIAELAKLAADDRPEAMPFCREVRQVRFNAWHYVDADLWASLAATLFDELARADAPDDKKTKLKELDAAREEVDKLRTKREDLQREVARLAGDVNRPKLAVNASVAIRAVRSDRHLVTKLRKVASGESADDDSAERLVNALGEIDGVVNKASVAWRLFEEEVLYRSRRATIFTLIVLGAVAVGLSVATSWSAGAKLLTFLGAVAAGLTPALKGVIGVLHFAREAREERELPLVVKRDELARAKEEEAAAVEVVEQREREFVDLRDRGLQLRNFIHERASSTDYRDKLGVISHLRRDFEKLATLMPGGQPEGVKLANEVPEKLRDQLQVDRIVLYIDDLDRCPHEKVVEVLQAVHLLLAFKLFVVVVGVDSRWLERSLRAHYENLLEDPGSYLEKIFQIPFTLPRMTPPRFQRLIDELTPPVAISELPAKAPAINPDPSTTDQPVASEQTVDPDDRTIDLPRVPPPAEPLDSQDAPDMPLEEILATPLDEPPLPRPEGLVISDEERRLLGQLGGIVGTPRATKRLVNIYRMLRVSVPDSESEAFRPGGGDEYQAAVVLLGILLGRPAKAPEVFAALTSARDQDDVEKVLRSVDGVYDDLATVLEHVTVVEAGPYRRWAPRVSRFSFRMAAATSTDAAGRTNGPAATSKRVRENARSTKRPRS